jgi:hypothetical protein
VLRHKSYLPTCDRHNWFGRRESIRRTTPTQFVKLIWIRLKAIGPAPIVYIDTEAPKPHCAPGIAVPKCRHSLTKERTLI